MSPEEEARVREALKRVGEIAREQAFAAGLPVAIQEDGRNIWLYEDGTTKPLEEGP